MSSTWQGTNKWSKKIASQRQYRHSKGWSSREDIRRVFTESVDANQKETQMYSAAIGLPGLIPIQYIFDRIYPSMLTAPFESALEDALRQTARDTPQIQKLTLRRFSMGDVAPRLLEARLFDLGDRDMAFDLEMSWTSNARSVGTTVDQHSGLNYP